MRITIPARIMIKKLAAGPASAIHADRRGYRRCHAGLNGALAQPIIQPPMRKERMGTTTMPNGERRICGIGLSVTWPPSAAVVSPPSLATRACAASWHVVENRKAKYQIAPIARSGVFMAGANAKVWLRGLDSNQDNQLQRLACYQLHYPGIAKSHDRLA